MNHPTPAAEDPEVGLSTADHMLGLEDAPVSLLAYGDYECPVCAQVEAMARHLVERFGPTLRYVFRHLQLSEQHLHAELAAETAEAATAHADIWVGCAG